jgi:P-type E1-E2 ATPase
LAFLGDGINDALALREADVGISVDSAADIGKGKRNNEACRQKCSALLCSAVLSDLISSHL